jgi:hypothetical protein
VWWLDTNVSEDTFRIEGCDEWNVDIDIGRI